MSQDFEPADPVLFASAHDLLAKYLEHDVASELYIQTVEYDSELVRWYVRFGCDGRDAATIYFDLKPRSLHYEVYFLPAPLQNQLEIYDLLLRANRDSYAVSACMDRDGEVYLVGKTLLEHLDEAEIDRIIGSIYQFTERWFPMVARLAFPRRT